MTDATAPGPRASLKRAWRALAWYVNGLTGQSKYACYLEHERAVHPDREPLSEREFWRRHYAAQDADPGARCC
ncbi:MULTISPECIES: YbdD/YjiX family protein [Microbacterium]|uniref:YbdD/YjiX family protein n=1 Tax=Microbacterium TaxID=33882 RepID=UPI00217EEA20|nr:MULTISPECIES: YbdD/YjiX family protein [Microbacterium]UWF78070.1 YbdD/YjiX family protein [Microbacterium neungamense]WCM56248.1 YbdD/YjiX family protein [Microbacterium sp. EF45047]